MMCSRDILASVLAVAFTVSTTITAEAQEPLRTQIDTAVSGHQSGATSAIASDSVFMRRVYLDLDREKFKGLKPLTEAMVLEFAASARAKLNATWGIAELGAAGPAGTPYGHGPGVSVIGVVGPKSASRTIETGSSNRIENMNALICSLVLQTNSADGELVKHIACLRMRSNSRNKLNTLFGGNFTLSGEYIMKKK